MDAITQWFFMERHPGICDVAKYGARGSLCHRIEFPARLSGDESLQQVINGELEQSEFVAGWLEGLRAFDALRQPYLLYPVQR